MFVGQQPVRGINTAPALRSPIARASSRPERRNTAHHRPRRLILSPASLTAKNRRRRPRQPVRQPPVEGWARGGTGPSAGMNAGNPVWIERFDCQENPPNASHSRRFPGHFAVRRLWIEWNPPGCGGRSPREASQPPVRFPCPRSARSRRSSNSCCGISDRGFRCVFSSSARSRGPSTCSASEGPWRGRPDAIRSSAVASATPGGARPGSPPTSSRSWRPSRWDPRQPDPRRQECAMPRGDRSTSVAAAAFGWWRSNGSAMPGRWCS